LIKTLAIADIQTLTLMQPQSTQMTLPASKWYS